jgi:hypothetical protein
MAMPVGSTASVLGSITGIMGSFLAAVPCFVQVRWVRRMFSGGLGVFPHWTELRRKFHAQILALVRRDYYTTNPVWSIAAVSAKLRQAATTDPAGKARKSTLNGLGRLTKVEEDPAGSDFITQYGHDLLGDSTSVSQGAQARSYSWNMRGWLQSSATQQGYDSRTG